jgi:CHC2 zinc finger
MKKNQELERIFNDALSLKLFGKNVNPDLSMAWVQAATEQEIAEWQHGDSYHERLLLERIFVQKQVKLYTEELMEEDMGIRHAVPLLEDVDYDRIREISIKDFTLQKVKRQGKNALTTCVFHLDKDPSCVLYEHKGYYCFSCGASGNAIDWTMREFGMSFPQAVDFLSHY